MLWVKFGKQKMKPTNLSLLMSEEQTPAAFHNQKASNQQNILSAVLLTLAFLPTEGKFLLFFGHKSAITHVSRANEIWLTEK